MILRLSEGPDVLGEYEEKRSRFVCVLRRCTSEAQARAHIAEQRHRYPSAGHHCSAFLIEVPDAARIERSNDDGEPSGTAGAPMLDVLRGSSLTDVCAVVVRWFGGTKLGAGGLARAYGVSVSTALDLARETGRIRRVERLTKLSTDVDLAVAAKVEAELRRKGLTVLGVEYGRRARISIATDNPEQPASVLAAATSGGAVWTDDGMVEFEGFGCDSAR